MGEEEWLVGEEGVAYFPLKILLVNLILQCKLFSRRLNRKCSWLYSRLAGYGKIFPYHDLLFTEKEQKSKTGCFFFVSLILLSHRFHYEYCLWEFVLPLFNFSLGFFGIACIFRHMPRFWKSVCFKLVIIVLVKDPKLFITSFYFLVGAGTLSIIWFWWE